MALESASTINQLNNAANPVSTDAISAADDHLRLIKSTSRPHSRISLVFSTPHTRN